VKFNCEKEKIEKGGSKETLQVGVSHTDAARASLTWSKPRVYDSDSVDFTLSRLLGPKHCRSYLLVVIAVM